MLRYKFGDITLWRCSRKDTHLSDDVEEVVAVSSGMISAGIRALLEESYSTPREDLVDLIYTAMEYQRRREAASETSSSR